MPRARGLEIVKIDVAWSPRITVSLARGVIIRDSVSWALLTVLSEPGPIPAQSALWRLSAE